MSIAEKLTYLVDTKNQLRTAIQAKGVAVPAETAFRDYAGKISQIEGGGVEWPKWVGSTWSEYVTSSTVTAPAFSEGVIQQGDLLVLTLMARVEPTSVPNGFQEVARSPTIGSTEQFSALYTKVADGTESTFQFALASSDRTCINVSGYRGGSTPQVVNVESKLIDTSSQDSYQINLGLVENPSSILDGIMCLSITTSLASTSGTTSALDRIVNIPFYGWSAVHNTYGTNGNHQNRMMINIKNVKAGESVPAKTDYVAMSNSEGLSTLKYLITL